MTASRSLAMSSLEAAPLVPMVMPANGSGGTVPLAIYPPGIDLTGFLIYDPLTGETVSGAGYSNQALSPLSVRAAGLQTMADSGGLSPLPIGGPVPDGGSAGTVQEPETGFYQVVKDGVQIWASNVTNLTSGPLSGTVNVTFETGNAANDGTGTNILGSLDSAVLLIDGAKFAGDGALSYPGDSLRFSMDTAYLENGDHTLQIVTTWINPDNSDGNNVNIMRWSDPVSFTVSNAIYYPQWESEIGEAGVSAYFLKSVCTNTDWQIDIFDVSSNFVQRLTGHTDDGTIAAYWNMVDTNGVTRTNADVDPEFSSVVTVFDPATANTPKKIQRHQDWPDHGVWTMAYSDFFKFEYSANNLMLRAIYGITTTAGKYGGYWLYYPQSGQTNDIGQTYPMRYQKSNHYDPSITATAIAKDQVLLKLYLSNTNSRNFFFDGHGSPQSFGGISSSELKKKIKHRYRFVMLDACETANGDLDKAFGINGPGTFDVTYYENTGIRPAAFCGYDTDATYAQGGQVTVNGVTYDDTIPDDVPYFISNFTFYWDADLMHQTLSDAINNAGANLPNPGGPGGRENHWKIYGYDTLRIDEVNHKGDTW
jgi:hypothetical protein